MLNAPEGQEELQTENARILRNIFLSHRYNLDSLAFDILESPERFQPNPLFKEDDKLLGFRHPIGVEIFRQMALGDLDASLNLVGPLVSTQRNVADHRKYLVYHHASQGIDSEKVKSYIEEFFQGIDLSSHALFDDDPEMVAALRRYVLAEAIMDRYMAQLSYSNEHDAPGLYDRFGRGTPNFTRPLAFIASEDPEQHKARIVQLSERAKRAGVWTNENPYKLYDVANNFKTAAELTTHLRELFFGKKGIYGRFGLSTMTSPAIQIAVTSSGTGGSFTSGIWRALQAIHGETIDPYLMTQFNVGGMTPFYSVIVSSRGKDNRIRTIEEMLAVVAEEAIQVTISPMFRRAFGPTLGFYLEEKFTHMLLGKMGVSIPEEEETHPQIDVKDIEIANSVVDQFKRALESDNPQLYVELLAITEEFRIQHPEYNPDYYMLLNYLANRKSKAVSIYAS